MAVKHPQPRKIVGASGLYDGRLLVWTEAGELFQSERDPAARIDDYGAIRWRALPPLPDPDPK